MKFLHQTAKSVAVVTTAVLSWSASAEAATFMSKDGPMAKVGSDLAEMFAGYQTNSQPDNSLMQVHDGHVVIDAVASGDTQTLLSNLQAIGLQRGETYGSMVSGLLPMAAIEPMANLNSLKFARPAYVLTNVGLTTSQADVAMRADVARSRFNVDGSGVTVGVLSDSFNNRGGAAINVANNDLPPNVNVLAELPTGNGSDEGRAMLQLIHDVALGANLAFHTAFGGQANFANGITRLANAGANVIVDDILYLDEPMFQDGMIAKAVDNVVANNVSYFSAAGNSDRSSYESSFRPSGQTEPLFGGQLHDFNPGSEVDTLQSITVPEGASFVFSMQWDSPFASVSSGSGGSPNDLDIFLFDSTGQVNTTNLITGSADSNIGMDAVEVFEFFNDGSSGTDQFNIALSNYAGPNAGLIKYVVFGGEGLSVINEYDTNSSTSFGHSNAAGAEAVGAAFYGETPEFGIDPALLEQFSSAGIVPILFDENGNRLSTPLLRIKPGIVAPDGTNTTFFGTDILGDPDAFPNFFGTSAAAPHAAAVAALMLQAAPGTSPSRIYDILRSTALDMDDPDTLSFFDTGFDSASGYGLIQADLAVQAVPEPSSVLGLLAFGSFGVLLRLRKNKQKAQAKSGR